MPKAQILEKIARCARHDDYHGRRKSGFCDINAENEDPAKMTYSIPDFVSRGTTKNQDFFQDLESGSPRFKIKTYRDSNPDFCQPLPGVRGRRVAGDDGEDVPLNVDPE